MTRFLRQRRLLAVAAFCALGLLVIGAQPAAGASTLVVDDDGVQCPSPDYNSINAAITAASPGTTINVCAGFYHEQVNVNKNNLTLLGAQANTDARTRAFLPDPTTQSIIEHECGPVQLEADNIVLNGFTVQGSTLTDPCFLAGIWSNPGFSGTKGGFEIVYNIVQDNISGIELDSNCDASSTLVQYNLIQNNSVPGRGSGNGIQTNFGLCNATIDSNKFSGHTNSSFLVVAASSNLTFSTNELVAGTPESIAFLNVTTATIRDNISTGSTNTFGTVDLFGGNSNITIYGNTLLDGDRAIVVENPFSTFGVTPNSNITAHQNCIKGNSVAGMEVDAGAYPLTPQLNAENNWWGSSSGPNEIPRHPTGTGDKIIDPDQNVDFDPWLTKPTAAPCPAAPPPPNTPGKVTGGGQIEGDPIFSPLGDLISVPALIPSLSGGNSQASFGFTVKCCPAAGNSATGNLEYNDHGAGVRIKSESIPGLNISAGACGPNTHASFKGKAAVIRSIGTTHEDFTVDVDDCNEPGKMDTFRIETDTYNSGPPKTLLGGNIQIHKS
jgi:hypothetical protein